MNLFFDLFYTLCSPLVEQEETEWNALGISEALWLSRAETEALWVRRELGIEVNTPRDIVRDITAHGGFNLTHAQLEYLTGVRVRRIRRAVTEIRPEVLRTLAALRAAGHKLCLVSNADAIDTLHFTQSPLVPLFDALVFSHQVHARKPDPAIYRIALARLSALPEHSVFIGDGGSREHIGARRAGMRTVLVTHLRPRTAEELHDLAPYLDAQTDDFSTLPDLLARL